MAGWNADTAAGPLGAGTVTLVEGSSFCISLPNGDIHPEHPARGFLPGHPHPVPLEPDRQRPAAGAAGGGNEGTVPGAVCRPCSPLWTGMRTAR